MAFGAGFVLSPILAACLAVLSWLLFLGVTAAHVRLLALLLGLLTAWRADRATDGYMRARQHWISRVGAHAVCSGKGVVVASPRLQRGKTVVIIDAENIDCDSQPAYGRARVRLLAEPRGIARGDAIEFIGELGPVTLLQNAGLRSPLPAATEAGVVASGAASSLDMVRAGHGLAHGIDQARNAVRSRITATFAPQAEALARALVLGENDLDSDDDTAFRRSGLSHLLAVSGTHLVFAVVAWMSALKALLLRFTRLSAVTDIERWIAILGGVTACLYADFAGGSGSAWRAAWMLSALYTGRLLARRVTPVQALALSLVVGSALDPWAGFELSFLLSAAATSGLITLGSRLARPCRRLPFAPLRAVALAASTTVSAMIPCAPFLALMSPDLTFAGIFANVLAGPLGEVASLPLCLIHAVSAFCPILERGLALCASGSLLLVNVIAHATASIAWARVRVPLLTGAHFCVLAFTVAAMSRFAGTARQALIGLGVAGLVGVELAAIRQGRPLGKLRLTLNDVGQGDSLLLDFPDGRCMLIDGGGSVTGGVDPGLAVLQPLFRARRRSRADVVVVTHCHPDHFGGLLSFLPTIDVGEVWMSEDSLPELRAVLADRHIPVRGLADICAVPHAFGAAQVQILGPCPDATNASNPNNASIVLKVTFGRRSAVLPGDAEKESEADLVERFASQLNADFLKVGHHGSRSSTSLTWLSAVSPTWAGVSLGARNRFGHPATSTLERLASANAVVLRTDELGSIMWQTDGVRVSLTTARARTELAH